MTIEQVCARTRQSPEIRPNCLRPIKVEGALINSLPSEGSGARQMDLKTASACPWRSRRWCPIQSIAKLFCGEYCRRIIDARSTSPLGLQRPPIRSALCSQLRLIRGVGCFPYGQSMTSAQKQRPPHQHRLHDQWRGPMIPPTIGKAVGTLMLSTRVLEWLAGKTQIA